MSIENTGICNDLAQMTKDTFEIINKIGWGEKNQISLTSRPTDINPWYDGVGKSTNRETNERIIYEHDFTIWNDIPLALKNNLLELAEKRNIKFGRIRIMRLMPQRGLTVHKDFETRYHYVIQTNPKSYFGFCQFENNTDPAAMCWHIPSDGQWYHVDTRKNHFVYNGGDTDRIHIVACAI